MRSSYVSVPLRGVGCFPMTWTVENINKFPSPCGVWVVSPYIYKDGIATGFPSPCGVWVVSSSRVPGDGIVWVSVPLRGVGCFKNTQQGFMYRGFPSPCGVWVVSFFVGIDDLSDAEFPSPCGVWVVSAKLHILSGATGKRIVNSAILLYHIGRCLSIAN